MIRNQCESRLAEQVMQRVLLYLFSFFLSFLLKRSVPSRTMATLIHQDCQQHKYEPAPAVLGGCL